MHAPELKPGNAARCHWQHAADIRTPLALLYLHGVSTSTSEAGARPEQMADALAANADVHRWPGHGLSTPDAMQGLTAAVLQTSALEALAQAQRMGQRIAIIGSSMGATLGLWLGLWLAAQRPDAVGAVVAWSPGIQPADPALLDQVCAAQAPLTDPRPRTPAAHAFWAETIHPDRFRALRSLFQVVATDPPWPRVRCPVLLGDDRATDGREDANASVQAMLDMFVALGTAPAHKQAIAFYSGAHAIGSPHKTPLADAVAQASVAFLQEQLGAAPQTGNA
ncbi:alpha/beta hydrolase [Xanthomonas oryzae]|uniref:alpha/beta hydrolase n=1 Tax=Xanthomonas oryzae TaxID=347 RepID=UPI000949DE9C|nr:alpha/beta hydrolase-fold protein [Xanthomonas oryzae]OLG90547.1 lysophospholipase [Xanthomonas oryzae pv. oryzae]